MHERTVAGFLPREHGFHFSNRWPPTPAFWLGVGYIHLGIGNVADGLCGGMAFVVRDRFEAGVPIPALTAPPPAGSDLFAEIVRRQVDSFGHLVRLPLRFWTLAALHPPGDAEPAAAGRAGWRGLPWLPSHAVTSVREWSRIRAQIDAGKLAMVGLLRSANPNPVGLGVNHQVLAWGYRVDGDALSLRIYDPNWPDRNDVEVVLGIRSDAGAAAEDGGAAIRLAQSTGEPLLAWFAAPWIPPRR